MMNARLTQMYADMLAEVKRCRGRPSRETIWRFFETIGYDVTVRRERLIIGCYMCYLQTNDLQLHLDMFEQSNGLYCLVVEATTRWRLRPEFDLQTGKSLLFSNRLPQRGHLAADDSEFFEWVTESFDGVPRRRLACYPNLSVAEICSMCNVVEIKKTMTAYANRAFGVRTLKYEPQWCLADDNTAIFIFRL